MTFVFIPFHSSPIGSREEKGYSIADELNNEYDLAVKERLLTLSPLQLFTDLYLNSVFVAISLILSC